MKATYNKEIEKETEIQVIKEGAGSMLAAIQFYEDKITHAYCSDSTGTLYLNNGPLKKEERPLVKVQLNDEQLDAVVGLCVPKGSHAKSRIAIANAMFAQDYACNLEIIDIYIFNVTEEII